MFCFRKCLCLPSSLPFVVRVFSLVDFGFAFHTSSNCVPAPPSVPNRHGSAIQAPPFRLRHVFPTRMATCGVRGEPSRRHHSRPAARWLCCFGSHCACGCLFAATSNNYFNILHPCLLLFDAIHIVPHHLSRRDLHITIVPFGFHASKPIPSPKQFRVNGLRVCRIIFCFFCSQLASCFDILRLCSWTVAAVFASNSCSRWLLLVAVGYCWVVVGCCSLLLFLCYQGSLQTAARRCYHSLCCSSCRAARGQWMA